MIESVKLPEVRLTIDEVLRGITTPRLLNEILCLTQLGKICRSLMNVLGDFKSGDLRLIDTLLHASQLIYALDGGKKVFLALEI